MFTNELWTLTVGNFTDICALAFGGGSNSSRSVQTYAIVRKTLRGLYRFSKEL
jgi:hypothetical protein